MPRLPSESIIISFHCTSNLLRQFRINAVDPFSNISAANKHANDAQHNWSHMIHSPPQAFNFHCFYSSDVKAQSVSFGLFFRRSAFLKHTMVAWMLQMKFCTSPNLVMSRQSIRFVTYIQIDVYVTFDACTKMLDLNNAEKEFVKIFNDFFSIKSSVQTAEHIVVSSFTLGWNHMAWKFTFQYSFSFEPFSYLCLD